MKRTRLERAAAAAKLYAPTPLAGVSGHILGSILASRAHYEYGWVDGHAAGTRDAQRRMARKFKQGLRLSWDKP